ncbi:GFA family protein [Woeseia oceani]|uniref:Aldehyde-activating protein n=1 Tax=Woeseia oceani TaxID=1548547 RepID=A0A193LHL3_9GAMM|nr:GFA family protein [Woeseia oceani]ANO51961.1 aldehyde-activating protein [Woeseia oceani]
MENTDNSTQHGRCLCGAVQFDATNAGTDFHACHCPMCRRWASGPLFAVNAESVVFSGEENLQRYASSDWAERGFCRQCGSNLFYFLKPANAYHLCVGAFDNAANFKIASEIFVDHQPAGYAFAGQHPRLTEQQVLEQFGSED